MGFCKTLPDLYFVYSQLLPNTFYKRIPGKPYTAKAR